MINEALHDAIQREESGEEISKLKQIEAILRKPPTRSRGLRGVVSYRSSMNRPSKAKSAAALDGRRAASAKKK